MYCDQRTLRLLLFLITEVMTSSKLAELVSTLLFYSVRNVMSQSELSQPALRHHVTDRVEQQSANQFCKFLTRHCEFLLFKAIKISVIHMFQTALLMPPPADPVWQKGRLAPTRFSAFQLLGAAIILPDMGKDAVGYRKFLYFKAVVAWTIITLLPLSWELIW